MRDETEFQGFNNEAKCAREKYWTELTDSEKIERMRDEVKRCQRKCDSLESVLNELRHHLHAADGQMLVPMGLFFERQYSLFKDKDQRF